MARLHNTIALFLLFALLLWSCSGNVSVSPEHPVELDAETNAALLLVEVVDSSAHVPSANVSPSPVELDAEMKAAILREVVESAHANDIGTFVTRTDPSQPLVVMSPEGGEKAMQLYVEQKVVEKSWFSTSVTNAVRGQVGYMIGAVQIKNKEATKKVGERKKRTSGHCEMLECPAT